MQELHGPRPPQPHPHTHTYTRIHAFPHPPCPTVGGCHCFPPTAVPNNGGVNPSSMSICQSMAALYEQQRQEIDRCLTTQKERLKVTLEGLRLKELTHLSRVLEANVIAKLRQKEEEIARLRMRATQLEESIRRIELDNQRWQHAVAKGQATIKTLSTIVEGLRGGESLDSNVPDYAESRCDGEVAGEEKTMLKCKRCNSRESRVLFLPCNHLCSCIDCEGHLVACPVCGSPKQAGIVARFV